MTAAPPRSPVSKRHETHQAVETIARLARLLERRCEDLSLAHYRVLAAVAGGDERASRVARRLAVGKPAVSAVVDALVQRGLLSRSGVTTDQRAVRLALTGEGRTVLDRAEREMARALEAVASLAADPQDALAGVARLGTALDAYLAGREPAR